jgi:hypothetical protein
MSPPRPAEQIGASSPEVGHERMENETSHHPHSFGCSSGALKTGMVAE